MDAFRVPLQRALRTGWINAAIVTWTSLLLPWTRKAHPAFGVAVYPSQPVSRTQTPGSAGADLLPGDTLTGKNTSQNLTAMLYTMALGWQNAQGSSQAKKAVGCPAMVSQALMELSRCSWPLGSPAQAVPHAMAAPAHGRAVY